MLRQIVLSSAIVLCVSASCFAPTPPPPPTLGIVQMQDYVIGATTGIELVHGHQIGQGSHTICINHDQCAHKLCGTFAGQSQTALLNQVGTAFGHCAVVGVGQVFNASGGQTQLIGHCVNPMLQGQGFGLFGSQLVAKSAGGGSGQAYHMFGGNQSQAAGNPLGTMLESASTGAFQNSSLAGSPGATGVVTGSMRVDTTQAQAIN